MIPVLIADDHPFMRAGLAAVLEGTEYRIVAAAASGTEALALVREHDPALCLFDVAMPDGDGVSTLRQLRAAGDRRPVILLTAQIDAGPLLDAIEAGVNAVLGKDGAEEVLLDTFAQVLAGERVIAPELLERARQEGERRRAPSPIAGLTPRERTIVSHVAKGHRNRDIAAELGITEGTVKVYLHALYQKLGIENRTELAVLALRHREEIG